MVKIRSSSPNVGVMIKESVSATYGLDPGTWSTDSYRVPFLSCDIKAEDEILPDSGEFTTLGAASQPVRGRRLARGSIVVEPVYDGYWFWKLFGLLGWGTEDLIEDESIEETGTPTGLNTHGFDIQTVSEAADLAMRIYKNSAYETYTGLIASRWVWEHAAGAIPTVTFDCVGVAGANPVTAGVADFDSTVPVHNRVKLTDLARADSDFKFGSTQSEVNINAFRLIGERSVDADDPEFLQSLLLASRPGQQENRAVSVELEGTLEAGWETAGNIIPEYLADTLSKGSIGYASSVSTGVSSLPYQIRFDMPQIVWTVATGDLTQLGQIPFTATGTCMRGDITGLAAGSNFNSHDGVGGSPVSGETDLRCLMHCPIADDGDAAWTSLGAST